MIDALFIISPRGDCILQRAFRTRQIKNIGEVFLKHARKAGAGPVIVIDECDTTFTYAKRGGLYFVFSMATVDVPLSVCCDLLESLVIVVKDMCGVLSEENLRTNFLLLNEIVDEMFDYGIPVAHDTQQLTTALGSAGCSSHTAIGAGTASKIFGSQEYILSDSWAREVFNSDTMAKLTNTLGLTVAPSHSGAPPRTLPSQASQAPVGKRGAAEIFVDIQDKVSAEIKLRDGALLRGVLDGYIIVKSYMDDYPTLKLGLNEELTLDNPFLNEGAAQVSTHLTPLVLDDCVFDDCVDSSELTTQKCLSFKPKKGEFILMRYRAQNFTLPFTLKAQCSVVDNRVEIITHLNSHAIRDVSGIVSINFALPVWAGQCHVALLSDKATVKKSQKVAINPSDKSVTWITRCLEAETHIAESMMGFGMRFEVIQNLAPSPISKLLSRGDGDSISQYLAPFRVNFDLPMYSSSKLQIRYIRCNTGAAPPQRWVRYVTQSDSFTACYG